MIDGDICNELPTADSRQPTADSRQPTAESSIQPNPQYIWTPTADSQILNPFSEQIIDGVISNELPTAERRQPTADSRILNPFSSYERTNSS